MIDLEKLLELLCLDTDINTEKQRYIEYHLHGCMLVNTFSLLHKVEKVSELAFGHAEDGRILKD